MSQHHSKQRLSLTSKHNEAADLVAQMTLEEKAGLCSGRNFWFTKAVERLGVPSVMMTDGPHGLRKQGGSGDHLGLNASVPATCFPTASALASSWDTGLLADVGAAIGRSAAVEAVALVLGPGLNIKRHPLCGRNFEYFSEDPYLSGRLAAAMVEGIQSQGVGACLKHFAINNQEAHRMVTDVVIDTRTIHEIYLRGFEIAIRESQPWAVMSAYNRINGVYCGDSDWLLTKVLRDSWGFEGLVVTDWGATNDRVRALAAGLDLEMPGSGGVNDERIVAAVRAGDLEEPAVDRCALRNVSLALLAQQSDGEDTPTPDDDGAHRLARRAAAESAVLLTNNGLLPVRDDARIAVIGEFARRPRFQGAGSSQVSPTQVDSAFDALSERLGVEPAYAPGYKLRADSMEDPIDEDLLQAAADLAASVEIVLLFVGLPAAYEMEGADRADLSLPRQHNALVERVCAANPCTVVVLTNGAPVTMPWVDTPAAILESYLAGQAGGSAVVDLLYGVVNPSGKLAETFPLAGDDFPAAHNFPGGARQVQYREGIYVGYRYYDSAQAPVLFAFGHGLSYTRFDYSDLVVSTTVLRPGKTVRVSVTVSNSGDHPGKEVVQLYAHSPHAPVPRPEQELAGFTKIDLVPGSSTRVTFELGVSAFEYFDTARNDWWVAPGQYVLRIGGGSRDIRAQVALTVQGGVDDPEEVAAAPPRNPARTAIDFVAGDVEFTQRLGYAIPPEEPRRPFHSNSTLGEIKQTFFGSRLYARARANFGGGDTSALTGDAKRMIDAMIEHMPLRALVLFSGGKLTFDDLDLMLHVLNYRFVAAARGYWNKRAANNAP